MQKNEKPVILVVDDTPANIHILVEALREEYDVMVAIRGARALELARAETQPDLILLDMMMPGMDGHEVCRQLKYDDRTRNIPIIFVTADTSPASEQLSFELGAVDYVTKPFSLPVVKARVRTHVTLKQRTDMLERLAKLDGLTGIANRRRFDELLQMEWQRCARKQMPLSALIADVDHFKLYNDTYGHGAGDKCLRGFGRLLEAMATRPGDLAARYGGEEFAVLLPFTPYEGAAYVAENLRKQTAEWCVDSSPENTSRRITISVGFATVIPHSSGDPANLLRVADEMLYEAKHAGRNCTRGIQIK